VELNAGIALAVRWVHLGASIAVGGAVAATLLAGRSTRTTALAWEARVLGSARWWLALALGSGVAVLASQTALAEGRADAALEARALATFLLETRSGHVWLARHGLLLLLAAFLGLGGDVGRRADWLAARGEAALLALAALVLLVASGHAAALEPGTARAMATDAVHLLAAGLWAGALVPVARLLAAASVDAGAELRPHAVRAARRFSRLALIAVLTLAASGAANAVNQVGSVAGLVGTPYGHLLLLKLALLVPILVLAVVNRRRLLPALSGDGATVGRPAMRRLAGLMTIEAALALGLLAVVAALGTTPPARHGQPTWPFPFRFSLSALDLAPELRLRALAGSQLAVLGTVALLAARLLRSRWRPAAAAGGALGGVGLGLMLPALAVDAYPTTYRRPAAAYHATSITTGARLYREHCAACHGREGAGDGPAARGGPQPLPDLRGPHTAAHTAGDLYWWITHGIPDRGMPGFAGRLGDEERWDLVNVVRALAAAAGARGLGPEVEPGRPWLVAPDFAFQVGPTAPQALRDHRGRRLVLLVLYTLPASRPRLAQLAAGYPVLAALGLEVIAVPRDGAADAIRRLGPTPPTLFPLVTEGAGDIVAAYDLLGGGPHTEFLIDRQGYLRARWTPTGEPVPDLGVLLGEVQALNAERAAAEAADEHVH
jgi:putative copper resistance protein D